VNKKRVVLYISPNGYLGGAERFVITAAKNHKNFSSHVLFFQKGEATDEAQGLNIPCSILETKFKLTHPWKFLNALIEIRKIVKKINPDIVHFTMPYGQITGSLALVGLKCSKVWFQHGPVGGLLDKVASLFSSDLILYNSQDLRQRHLCSVPVVRTRNEAVIHLGVNSDHNRKVFEGPIIQIGTAGRMCSWKGFELSIMALSALKKSGNLKAFHFHLAGEPKNSGDVAYFENLKALTQNSNIQDEVTFHGHVSDTRSFYRGLDVFIHSSLIPEPFGLVVAEAMGSGCLVFGSNVGGVKDLLNDGITGFSFNSTGPNAVEELKGKLKAVLDKEGPDQSLKFSKIASEGQDLIKIKYSISSMIDELEKLYQKLLTD